MAILSKDQQSKLRNLTPGLEREQTYKNIPIAVGKVTMAASPTTVTVPGLLATDIVVASIDTNDTTGAGVITATCGTGEISITSSEVTSADGVVGYAVYKA